MSPEDFDKITEFWASLAGVLTAGIWIAWLFGRIALSLIELKK